MLKRAVTYARVSSDDRGKDGRNLQGQLEMCRDYAKERGYKIVSELAEDDRGASGASFELPKLNQLRGMAHNNDFDVLVVREIDRLSRNLAKQLIVEEGLRRAGVRIEYVLGEYPDTPEGNLMKHVRATVAEYEREKINERMTRGRRLKIKAGHVVTHGKFSFGYRLVDKNGKRSLEIYEPEARIVRLIFDWYTNGNGESGSLTMSKIALHLTEMGVPSPKDSKNRTWGSEKKRGYGEWGRGSIQKILNNTTYKGEWRYGKKAKKDGKWLNNTEDHILTVKVPAIIDMETWEAAERRHVKNKLDSRRNIKNEYLLSKRVTCGLCGHRAFGTVVNAHNRKYLYYRCGAAKGSSSDIVEDCNLPMFNAKILDRLIWEKVKSFILDPAALQEGILVYQEKRDKENAPIRERLQVVDDLLANNQAQLTRALDFYLVGDFPKEMLLERSN